MHYLTALAFLRLTRSALASPSSFSVLSAKLESRSARAGVIGLGYVGLPLAIAVARSGFTVTGFDIDPRKIVAARRPQILYRRGYGRGADRRGGGRPLSRRRPISPALPPATSSSSACRRRSRNIAIRIFPSSRRPRVRSPSICAPGSLSCWNRRPIPARPTRS